MDSLTVADSMAIETACNLTFFGKAKIDGIGIIRALYKLKKYCVDNIDTDDKYKEYLKTITNDIDKITRQGFENPNN